MAGIAQRDQVKLGVVSLLAFQRFVVHIEILVATTILASPIVPLQHPLTEFFVNVRIDFIRGLLELTPLMRLAR